MLLLNLKLFLHNLRVGQIGFFLANKPRSSARYKCRPRFAPPGKRSWATKITGVAGNSDYYYYYFIVNYFCILSDRRYLPRGWPGRIGMR